MESMDIKRLSDIIISAVTLLTLSPFLLLIGVIVRAESSGPAVYKQTRVGKSGRPFTLFKFRSMSVSRAGGAEFTPGQKARVTRFGRILRKSKLDELPQLWNVLVGDMSIVGPRPEVPAWTKVYPERWEIVLSVRPGITDPASIVFRDEEEILAAAADPDECYRSEILPRKLDLATEYAIRRTLLGDLKIVMRTVLAVLRPPRPQSAPDEIDR
jgi:lipopolysaccharide/colanic/teichoic acid biosynthesis glycosyltransferase